MSVSVNGHTNQHAKRLVKLRTSAIDTTVKQADMEQMKKVTSYFAVATDDPWMKNEGVGDVQNLFIADIIAD